MPFAANGLLAMAYNRFDVLVVAGLASMNQLALYAPASRIQDALYMIPASIGTVGYPMISRAWAGADGAERVPKLVRRLIVFGLGLTVPVTFAVFLFTPQLLGLILGPEYSGAVTSTRILIWFLPMAAVGGPLLAALAGTGHANDTSKAFAVTFLVAMAMHLLLDRRFGAIGGAIASLSRDPAGLLYLLFLSKRAGLLNSTRSAVPTSAHAYEGGVVTGLAAPAYQPSDSAANGR
jgi:O-antigen/teichoic acid export membrane protein